MLSLLAISFNTVRLGLEAQNAAAFRLLRLAVGASKRRRTLARLASPLPGSPIGIAFLAYGLTHAQFSERAVE
jgi:hypothetical protein